MKNKIEQLSAEQLREIFVAIQMHSEHYLAQNIGINKFLTILHEANDNLKRLENDAV